jgi:hypothetical protein
MCDSSNLFYQSKTAANEKSRTNNGSNSSSNNRNIDEEDDALTARAVFLSQLDAGMNPIENNTDQEGDTQMNQDEEDKDVLVTADNVEEFVELYSSAILRWNVIDQLDAMRNGLMEFVPPSAWRGVSPVDFNLLVGGTPNITFGEIKKRTHISCGGGGAATQLIATWFWTIIESMTQLQRSKLLYFSTGSTRLPSGTTRALVVEIASSLSTTSLPTSVTCSRKLVLPSYSSFEQLQSKLLLAIENCTNYELQ